jgi:hypothetical protein
MHEAGQVSHRLPLADVSRSLAVLVMVRQLVIEV